MVYHVFTFHEGANVEMDFAECDASITFDDWITSPNRNGSFVKLADNLYQRRDGRVVCAYLRTFDTFPGCRIYLESMRERIQTIYDGAAVR